ncbi:MAG: hypothetical protein HXS44_06440 [Theionarchaea archaeon]|nr:hypothetical protein [Theionarchaea archaeon]
MFLEVSYHLIKDNGRIGMIVPSGIYTDQGTAGLRKLFLDRGSWIWLFGFENRNRIFQIDSRYKFGPLIVEKSRKTNEIKSSFMNRDLGSWETSDTKHFLIKEEQITKYSPNSRSIFEFLGMRDISITDTIYSNSILISDESSDWGISYHREIDMTNDSNLFETIQKVKARGYNQNRYGLFVNSDDDIYLPLYEGRMVGQFDFSQKEYVSGKGRRATWTDIPWDRKMYHPQYLMHSDIYLKSGKCVSGYKVGFMDVTSATNTRSMISCLIVDLPCGNKVPVLQIRDKSLKGSLVLCSILNSFVFDFVTRLRLGGLSLNWYIVKELPIPRKIPMAAWEYIVKNSASLIMISNCFAKEWLLVRGKFPSLCNQRWQGLWVVTEHERLRSRCILDAIIAELYGLCYDDLAWILRDDPSNPKGFWRLDKDKPPELRQTTLTLLAFRRLKEIGLEAFCKEDWQFPKDIQEKLGPRFLPWQLEGTPEDTWAECEQHAKNILGEEKYKEFIEELNRPKASEEKGHTITGPDHTHEKGEEGEQTSLLSWEVER